MTTTTAEPTTAQPSAAIEPAAPVEQLTPAQRRGLKARAHNLHPVVLIGDKGLTDAVLRELDVSLKSHGLVKVRVADADREAREAMLQTICTRLCALPVQHIGKILVVYREKPRSAKASGDPDASRHRGASRTKPNAGPARPRVPDDRLRRLGGDPGSSVPRSAGATRARPRGRTG